MREPTPSERRLLALFVGAAFLALNVGGCRLWQNAVRAQTRAIASTEAAIADAKGWITTAEAIGESASALPPLPPMAANDAPSELLQAARNAAGSGGLTVTEETLGTPPEDLPVPAAVLRVKLSGPWKGLVRFLHEIQTPEAWRAVEQGVVKADSTPQNVLAELELRQYFEQSQAAPSTGGAVSSP